MFCDGCYSNSRKEACSILSPVIYYTKSGVEGVLAVTAFVILTVIPMIIEITGDVQYKRRSSYNER